MKLNRLLALHLIVFVAPAVAAESGRLVIVGGGGTPESVLKRAVDFAGGSKANVIVLPQASNSESRGQDIQEAFTKLGAAKVQILELEDLVSAKQKIASADLIWFSGGQQSRLIQALDHAGVSNAIRQRHRDGATVGGTSAGAAVMSAVMITALPERPGLRTGNTPTMQGLGLAAELIIDQHFVERRRMNRLLSATLEHREHVGVGISEQTAIIVSGGAFEVAGKGTVVVMDARKAEIQPAPKGELQSAAGITMHVLRSGQSFRFRGP